MATSLKDQGNAEFQAREMLRTPARPAPDRQEMHVSIAGGLGCWRVCPRRHADAAPPPSPPAGKTMQKENYLKAAALYTKAIKEDAQNAVLYRCGSSPL